MSKDHLIVIGGAGGFIGGHLVADLLRQGHTKVRAVDIKPVNEWYQVFDDVENLQLDLREKADCYRACDAAGVSARIHPRFRPRFRQWRDRDGGPSGPGG